MSLLFIILWGVIIYYSGKVEGIFLYYFVLGQFLFVGFGLAVFPFLGIDYLQKTFATLNFSSIEYSDFNVASLVVLSGVVSSILSYTILSKVILSGKSKTKNVYQQEIGLIGRSKVRRSVLFVMFVVSLVVSGGFIFSNYVGLFYTVLANTNEALGNALAYRREATSNYLQILYIYNILPALTVLSFLYHLETRRIKSVVLFLVYFFITTVSLLLTYQKRPLLIFFGSLAITRVLYKHFNSSQKYNKILFKDMLLRLKIPFLLMVGILFVFYFFYTGFRFSAEPIELVLTYTNIIVSRLFGRLSIPAAMYIDFFPAQHPFYGFENIGLFSNIFNTEIFRDSSVVFSQYSLKSVNGSVAASIFIDAYGQGGIFVPPIYGIIVGFLIAIFESLRIKVNDGVGKVFLIVFVLIFLYYLSQASFFRSLLGYGGIFYCIVWIIGFKKQFVTLRG